MTKEEYISERKAITEQIDALYEREAKITEAYINEHKEFDKGDKVRLFTAERTHPFNKTTTMPEFQMDAYIKCVWENNGVIKYEFWKTKKDGSQSSHTYHWPSYDRIELIEKAK